MDDLILIKESVKMSVVQGTEILEKLNFTVAEILCFINNDVVIRKTINIVNGIAYFPLKRYSFLH